MELKVGMKVENDASGIGVVVEKDSDGDFQVEFENGYAYYNWFLLDGRSYYSEERDDPAYTLREVCVEASLRESIARMEKELESMKETLAKEKKEKKVDWREPLEEGKFIGFENKGTRYFYVKTGSASGTLINALNTWSSGENTIKYLDGDYNKEISGESTIHIFDTEKELYAWMAE
jgi:hypothetical protein